MAAAYASAMAIVHSIPMNFVDACVVTIANGQGSCMYYGHSACCTMSIMHAYALAEAQPSTMAIVRAFVMAVAHAFVISTVLAYALAVVRACGACCNSGSIIPFDILTSALDVNLEAPSLGCGPRHTTLRNNIDLEGQLIRKTDNG